MIKLYRLWMNLFGPRNWEPAPDANNPSDWVMRRWSGETMEYRQPTDKERDDAYLDWATK